MNTNLLAQARQAYGQGNLAEASRLYSEMLRLNPRSFEALYILGFIAFQQGRLDEAERTMANAVATEPRSPEAAFVHGCVLQRLRRTDEAIDALSRAASLRPDFAEALVNRGAILLEAGRNEEAIADFDAALARNPTLVAAWNNRGNALSQIGRPREAVESYDRVLALQPNIPQTLSNRGTALLALGEGEAALASYEAALHADFGSAEAWNGQANALTELKRYDQAIASYEQALKRDPACSYAWGSLALARLHCCDWRHLESDRSKITFGLNGGTAVVNPFQDIALGGSPEEQLRAARIWARDKYPLRAPLWRGERYGHERLRIAYVSADFRDHAVASLMAGVFAAHDKSRFEIVAVSLTRAPGDATREKLLPHFDRFVDASEADDARIAALLRKLEIDVAIDLMGYTGECRPGIFAHRPAPAQANYLGYPGTMGAEFMDFILADETVIPRDAEQFYSETVIRLPDCYLPADNTRALPARPSRGDAGLPEHRFVFCSFNNSYKLGPDIFGVWMRLLNAVPDGVLWLAESNAVAMANLRREAEARGIAPDRLIFAPFMKDRADHLARLQLADLFLDTLPYNAHATAIDALWAGVPLITCRGKSFAGRVAASALTALKVFELNTPTLEQYESLALELARDSERLAAIREKIAQNRTTAPLFDTARFTRNLEAAYVEMTNRKR